MIDDGDLELSSVDCSDSGLLAKHLLLSSTATLQQRDAGPLLPLVTSPMKGPKADVGCGDKDIADSSTPVIAA